MAYQPKSYRKFVATAATATLVASAVTPAFAAETGAAASFTDVSDRYKEAVDFLLEEQITNGYTDTQFGTQLSITRVDAAIMIAKALGLDLSDRTPSGFTDVPERGVVYVDALKEEGIINGKTATSFGADQNITRGEIALILANAYDLNGTSDKEFSDVSSRYDAAVQGLVAAGITQGKTETTFGTADAITRGEFAIFLFKAEKMNQPGVSNVTASTTGGVTTVSATVANAKDGDQATIEIFANGNTSAAPAYTKVVTVTGGKVSTTFNGVPAGTHLAKVTVGEVSGQANFTVAQVDANVGAATAINDREIQVTFDQPVDKNTAIDADNYTFLVNGSQQTVVGDPDKEGKLLDDGRTVLFRLTNAIPTNAKYAVNISDGVLDTQLKAVKPFASGEMTFNDTKAPTLSEVKANVQTQKLLLTFNEPVSTIDSIKVDGGTTINNPVLVANAANEPGNYNYTVDQAVPASAVTVGTHNVVLYNVADANGNTSAIINKTYTVNSDTTAPSVTKVEAVNSHKVRVTFSEELKSAPKFDVKKGNYTFTQTTGDTANAFEVYADPKVKDSYLIVFNGAQDNDPNALYGKNEATAALTIETSNYRDNADLVGQTTTSNVTLTKDTKTPAALNAGSNTVTTTFTTDDTLSIKFNGALATTVDSSKVIVRDKNGALISKAAVTATGDVVNVRLVNAYDSSKAPYTVEFQAGAVQFTATASPTSPNTASDYTLNNNKNVAFTTSVERKGEVDAVAVKEVINLFGTTGTVTVDNEARIIEINYAEDMGASAKDVSNYTFDGKSLPAGTTTDFIDGMKKVRITLPENSVKVTETGRFEISTNVLTAKGSKVVANAQTKAAVVTSVELEDNTDPKLVSAQFFKTSDDATTSDTLYLKFDENVKVGSVDNDEFSVKVGNVEIPVATANSGNIAEDEFFVVKLGQAVNIAQSTTVAIQLKDGTTVVQSIDDIEGNDVKTGTVTVTGTTRDTK